MEFQNSQQALAELQNQRKSVQTPDQLLAQQQKQLGVNTARDTATGLRGAITNTTRLLEQVAPSIRGRTQGSLVTNAQATRQIANEQAPIATDLTKLGQDYSVASEDLRSLEDRAGQLASAAYTGQQDRLSYLQNLYNTLYAREEAEKAREEQIRQFNEEQARLREAAKASASGGLNLGSLVPTPAAPTARVEQPRPGDFKFYGADNKPITAAQYAQQKSRNLGELLADMAEGGDMTARNVYEQLRLVSDSPVKYHQRLTQLKEAYPWLLGGV